MLTPLDSAPAAGATPCVASTAATPIEDDLLEEPACHRPPGAAAFDDRRWPGSDDDRSLAVPRFARASAAPLVAPKACATSARLTARCGAVWSAMVF